MLIDYALNEVILQILVVSFDGRHREEMVGNELLSTVEITPIPLVRPFSIKTVRLSLLPVEDHLPASRRMMLRSRVDGIIFSFSGLLQDTSTLKQFNQIREWLVEHPAADRLWAVISQSTDSLNLNAETRVSQFLQIDNVPVYCCLSDVQDAFRSALRDMAHQIVLMLKSGMPGQNPRDLSFQARFLPRFNSDRISRILVTGNEYIIKDLAKRPDGLYELHPGKFEEIVGNLLEADGFEVTSIGNWNQGDGGVDLIAAKRISTDFDIRLAVQCKRFSKDRIVRAEVVRALNGVLSPEGCHAGIVATTSYFAPGAYDEVQNRFWKISLKDRDQLIGDLRNFQILKQ